MNNLNVRRLFHAPEHNFGLYLVGRTRSLLDAPRRSEVERDVNEFFDQAELEIAKPLYELESMNDVLYPYDSTNLVTLLLNDFVPSLDRVRHNAERTNAARDGILIGIALELFHREQKAWPTALDELVPNYMPSLPVDPLTGEPLHYRVTDDGPLVYSVGTDGDDDGGVAGLLGNAARNNRTERSMWAAFFPGAEVDGDVPLWPPVP